MGCEKCGYLGFIVESSGKARRCECKEKEILKMRLGPFYVDNLFPSAALVAQLSNNIRIESSLTSALPWIAGAVLAAQDKGLTVSRLDSWRLYTRGGADEVPVPDFMTPDLVVLVLGVGEGNGASFLKWIGNWVLVVLERRMSVNLPIWVVHNMTLDNVASRYGQELKTLLGTFKYFQTS